MDNPLYFDLKLRRVKRINMKMYLFIIYVIRYTEQQVKSKFHYLKKKFKEAKALENRSGNGPVSITANLKNQHQRL